jgi:Copper binding proteins, plastocyanin/azurin family
MTPRRIALILVLGLVLAAPAAGSTGLVGQTGPGFQIQVKLNGKTLKTIKAGTYTLKVEDKSSAHNFRLRGPGLNRSTSVGGTGEFRWRIRLKPGTYTFQCDPHAAMGMKGTFRVTK